MSASIGFSHLLFNPFCRGYGEKEGDARQFHPKLRPPVHPEELEIDRRTGMKVRLSSRDVQRAILMVILRRTTWHQRADSGIPPPRISDVPSALASTMAVVLAGGTALICGKPSDCWARASILWRTYSRTVIGASLRSGRWDIAMSFASLVTMVSVSRATLNVCTD